ncbi:MAG TPA: nicotinate-nucleotide adenylyltransferase [Candidatus Limnocylindrales bacterium]|nr:nicotinate-nucleotide adenylyltransferase [Candidatus Limnocylindrales bacterium]
MTAEPAPVVVGTLGVFGGTFDPIHFAHLAVAQEAADVLGLERVLFVPAGEPPHKPNRAISAGADRLAMVELAIAGNERFAVDRQELERRGPSYTVDTLEALRASRTAAGIGPDLTLILSADAFLGLTTWHEPHRVLELARMAVAPRDGYPAAAPSFLREHFPDMVDRAIFLDGPRMRLSASELRRRAAAGRSLRYLVPDAVAAYIDDHALYRNPRRNVES